MIVKIVRVCYTILDLIEVPDDFTDEQIEEACLTNWKEYNGILTPNDIEWEDR